MSESSHYFINQELIEEMVRLTRIAQLNTTEMGGLLSEQNQLIHVHDVVDLACGPGEWVMKLATDFPHMRVTGVDISHRMIAFARVQAEAEELNVSFQEMDILKQLDFPDASFDLVNSRFIMGFMVQKAWPSLLSECYRVLRPGGIVRITEPEGGLTNDVIMQNYLTMMGAAWRRAGRSFSHTDSYTGITIVLKDLMRKAGFLEPKNRPVMIDIGTGTPRHRENIESLLETKRLARDFLLKFGATPAQIDECESMRTLINKPGFCAEWLVQTVWAQKPSR